MTIEEEIRRIVRDEIGRFFEGYKMVEPDTGGMTVEPVEKSPFADVVPEKPKAACTCLRHHHVVVNYNDTCGRTNCFCKSPADGRVQTDASCVGCGHPRDKHHAFGCHAPGSDDIDLCPCERVYGE